MDNLSFEASYKKLGFAAQRRYPNEALLRFLAPNYFSLPRSKRSSVKILEVGCGSGANLWVIAKEGFAAYGMDIAESSIALCKQMLDSYGVKAKLSVGTMQALDYDSNFFDAIVDVMTIEHTDLEGHKNTFKEIFRCLKPGGRFFSWHLGADSTPFLKGGGKRVDALTVDDIPNKNVPYHGSGITCFMTPAMLRRQLRAAGFVDIRIERVTRSYKNMTQKTEYFEVQAQKP